MKCYNISIFFDYIASCNEKIDLWVKRMEIKNKNGKKRTSCKRENWNRFLFLIRMYSSLLNHMLLARCSVALRTIVFLPLLNPLFLNLPQQSKSQELEERTNHVTLKTIWNEIELKQPVKKWLIYKTEMYNNTTLISLRAHTHS